MRIAFPASSVSRIEAMTASTYKGYEKQANGSHSGTWGDVLNDDVFSIVDKNLGGVVTITLASSNVVLSASEAQNGLIILDGTLGANVQVTSPANGFYCVSVEATVGAFTITWTNGSGTALTLTTDRRYIIFGIAGVGVRVIGFANDSDPVAIPTGTMMLFMTAAVPTGWTLYTALNDYTLKLSSTQGAQLSGSVPFSTILSTTSTGQHQLTIP